MKEFIEKTLELQRNLVWEIYRQLIESQQVKFLRLFPQGIDELGGQKLVDAYDICARTVKKNKSAMIEYASEGCCSCHINPPCSYCVSKEE